MDYLEIENKEQALQNFKTNYIDNTGKIYPYNWEQLKPKLEQLLVDSLPVEAQVKPATCEHNFQIAKRDYYKPDGGQNVFGKTYDHSRTYSTLFCTKCGETKEIITS